MASKNGIKPVEPRQADDFPWVVLPTICVLGWIVGLGSLAANLLGSSNPGVLLVSLVGSACAVLSLYSKRPGIIAATWIAASPYLILCVLLLIAWAAKLSIVVAPGSSSLMKAAEQGDVRRVEVLLHDPAVLRTINATNRKGRTAVDLGIESGDARTVDVLLSHGASVERRYINAAIEANDPAIVKAFADRHAPAVASPITSAAAVRRRLLYGEAKRSEMEKNLQVLKLLSAAGYGPLYDCDPLIEQYPAVIFDKQLFEITCLYPNKFYLNADTLRWRAVEDQARIKKLL